MIVPKYISQTMNLLLCIGNIVLKRIQANNKI